MKNHVHVSNMYIYICKSIIWILGTPISSVGPSISKVTFDIEVFDIVCTFDIEGLRIRYRISISKVFDIEDNNLRYRIG